MWLSASYAAPGWLWTLCRNKHHKDFQVLQSSGGTCYAIILLPACTWWSLCTRLAGSAETGRGAGQAELEKGVQRERALAEAEGRARENRENEDVNRRALAQRLEEERRKVVEAIDTTFRRCPALPWQQAGLCFWHSGTACKCLQSSPGLVQVETSHIC